MWQELYRPYEHHKPSLRASGMRLFGLWNLTALLLLFRWYSREIMMMTPITTLTPARTVPTITPGIRCHFKYNSYILLNICNKYDQPTGWNVFCIISQNPVLWSFIKLAKPWSSITAELKRYCTVHSISWSPKFLTEMCLAAIHQWVQYLLPIWPAKACADLWTWASPYTRLTTKKMRKYGFLDLQYVHVC